MYLRLSTRPIDQAPFEAARARLGDEQLRTDVLAGGYRLVEGAGRMVRRWTWSPRARSCPKRWPRPRCWPPRVSWPT